MAGIPHIQKACRNDGIGFIRTYGMSCGEDIQYPNIPDVGERQLYCVYSGISRQCFDPKSASDRINETHMSQFSRTHRFDGCDISYSVAGNWVYSGARNQTLVRLCVRS